MSRRFGLVAAAVLGLLVLVPDLAHACAVCFDQKEKNRAAFFATTVFMSLLPLGMAGGLGLWLRRRLRTLRGLEAAEAAAAERPAE